MTQNEKKLLLRDLAARLPYKVMAKIEKRDMYGRLSEYDCVVYLDDYSLLKNNGGYRANNGNWYRLQSFSLKPYLRPMSSMTEKEQEKLDKVIELEIQALNAPEGFNVETCASSVFLVDFLNAHYFDYRGLIQMGLALEAPKEMYNTNE